MSVPKRVSAMGPDGTELNLDGISKPELEKIPEARAKELTGNRFDSSVCQLGIYGPWKFKPRVPVYGWNYVVRPSLSKFEQN